MIMMNTAVSATRTTATGQATTAITTMADRTTTTIRSTPHSRVSMPSTSAQENELSDEATSPAGWSTCQR